VSAPKQHRQLAMKAITFSAEYTMNEENIHERYRKIFEELEKYTDIII
jgi:hypothetical protein